MLIKIEDKFFKKGFAKLNNQALCKTVVDTLNIVQEMKIYKTLR